MLAYAAPRTACMPGRRRRMLFNHPPEWTPECSTGTPQGRQARHCQQAQTQRQARYSSVAGMVHAPRRRGSHRYMRASCDAKLKPYQAEWAGQAQHNRRHGTSTQAPKHPPELTSHPCASRTCSATCGGAAVRLSNSISASSRSMAGAAGCWRALAGAGTGANEAAQERQACGRQGRTEGRRGGDSSVGRCNCKLPSMQSAYNTKAARRAKRHAVEKRAGQQRGAGGRRGRAAALCCPRPGCQSRASTDPLMFSRLCQSLAPQTERREAIEQLRFSFTPASSARTAEDANMTALRSLRDWQADEMSTAKQAAGRRPPAGLRS